MSEKNFFETKIEFIKGVGPKRAAILNKELGVYKFSDLIEKQGKKRKSRNIKYQ